MLPQEENKNIIISEQTADSIACISEHLEEWIPDDMTVVFVSPEDLENCEEFYDSLPENFKEHVSLETFSQLKNKGGPCAGNLDIDGDGINDIGYVLTHSISASKEEIATGYANIAPDNLNLPGSDEEWRAAVVAHEIGHLDQKPRLVRGRLSILGLEMDADQNSIDNFSLINAEVAQARLECRILGAFTSGTAFQNSHITSAGVMISQNDHIPNMVDLTDEQRQEIYIEILRDNEELNILTPQDQQEIENAIHENRQINNNILSVTAEEYWKEKCRYAASSQYSYGLNNARQTTYYTLGVQNFEHRDENGDFSVPLSFKKEILSSTRPGNIKIQDEEVTVEDQEIINKILKDEIPFEEGLTLLSPELVRNYESSLESIISNIGRNVAHESPRKLYEATEELYLSGAFLENPIGEQYAWEFLEAGRKLASDYFDVPKDKPPFTAPTHNDISSTTSMPQPFDGVSNTLTAPHR